MMDYHALHYFSRKALKKRYFRALRATWFLTGLWLLYRLLPVGMVGLLLVRGGSLREHHGLWLIFLTGWTLFCMGMMLPVRCAVWKRFGAWLGLTDMRTCFPGLREYCRAAKILGLAGSLHLLAALPAALSGYLAIRLIGAGSQHLHAGWYLFWAVQCLAALFWLVLSAIRLRVDLFAVPVLCMECPQESAFSVIRHSFRLMQGQHWAFWSVVLCYLPAMVTILPVPFLLPRLYADLTLFLQLRIREASSEGGILCPT